MNREEAKLKIEWIRDGNDFTPTDAQVIALDMAIEALKDRPTGKWVKAVDDGVWSFTDAYAECDQCHKVTFNGWNMDYCPSCGASMRGKDNG